MSQGRTDANQSPVRGRTASQTSSEEADDPTLSFILPTKNEEGGIASCLETIDDVSTELGLPTEIIVSDSSTDRTPEIARSYEAKVVNPDRPGYGYAYRYAFEHATGDIIVMGDADTTYDFSETATLIHQLEDTGADMVIGDRFGGEIKSGAMPPLHQYVGNPMLTKFLNVFYDAGVGDAHCGLRVASRDAIERLSLESDGMEFASEMIMDASARGLTIEQVPITYYPREGESTLESLSDGWNHLRFMLLNAPEYVFSIPGVLVALAGVLVMGLAFSNTELAGVSGQPIWFGTRSMVAGSLMTIVGYQVASQGVFSTMASDPIRRPTNRVTIWLVEQLKLEHLLSLGGLLLFAGVGYSTLLLLQWLNEGYNALPALTHDILAFTIIILGVQTVFGALFLGSLKRSR